MKRPFCSLVLAFVAVLFLVGTLTAADRIVMQEGRGKNVSGSIVFMGPEKVTVDVKGEKQEIAANIIAYTVLDSEPGALTNARNSIINSRMQEAIDTLSKLDQKGLTNDYMKQDYAYCLAYAKAKLVQGGGGNAADAEKELLNFIKTYKDKSYHYYDICEAYGDLMTEQGRFDDAKKSYAVLAKAPWPEYSLKATVALGMAEISEKKADAAKKNFETVIASSDSSPEAERQKSIAKIGLALCLVADKKYDDAIKSLEQIAREAGSEDSVFQALVYNSLGNAYDQAGKPRDAVLAYMHTDILFAAARSEHIKALQQLYTLWKKVQRTDRAEDVAKRLKDQYNIAVK